MLTQHGSQWAVDTTVGMAAIGRTGKGKAVQYEIKTSFYNQGVRTAYTDPGSRMEDALARLQQLVAEYRIEVLHAEIQGHEEVVAAVNQGIARRRRRERIKSVAKALAWALLVAVVFVLLVRIGAITITT